MSAPKPKTFRATLEHLNSNLGWVVIPIPFDVKKAWGSSRIKVRGQVNGVSFRTSLFAKRDGSHFMLVNKKVQRGAHIFPGVTAEFRLEVDAAPREIANPPELETILRQSKKMRSWLEHWSYSYRRYIAQWISEPKGTEARRRRADQIAERILETIDAEQELPPLMKAAFAQNGKAREGWRLMTPKQRRGELFAVFYYRAPDSRARRLAKMVQAAADVAERREVSGRS